MSVKDMSSSLGYSLKICQCWFQVFGFQAMDTTADFAGSYTHMRIHLCLLSNVTKNDCIIGFPFVFGIK